MDVSGKNILITGIDNEIGFEVAFQIAKMNAKSLTVTTFMPKDFSNLDKLCKDKNCNLRIININFMNSDAPKCLITQLSKDILYDIFISCHSISKYPISEDTIESSNQIMQEIYISNVDLTNEISKGYLKRGGSIVYLIHGTDDITKYKPIYISTHESLAMFSKVAAIDLGKKSSTRVNAVSINDIESELIDIVGISYLLIFLASDSASDITGIIQKLE